MNAVFWTPWVRHDRGLRYFPQPPFYAFYDNFESYSTGTVRNVEQGVHFNTIGTGVWGIVNVTGRTRGTAYSVESYFFDSFESYQSGLSAISYLNSGSASGVNVRVTTGYATVYESYFADMFESYSTGTLSGYDLGVSSGAFTLRSGYVYNFNS